MNKTTKSVHDSQEVQSNKTTHPKWAAAVDDEPIPMPQRHVKVSVIREQAAIRANLVLVRDYESPTDVALRDDETIDLAEGNVFYTLAECDAKLKAKAKSPAKLAYFVDDRPELTVNRN